MQSRTLRSARIEARRARLDRIRNVGCLELSNENVLGAAVWILGICTLIFIPVYFAIYHVSLQNDTPHHDSGGPRNAWQVECVANGRVVQVQHVEAAEPTIDLSVRDYPMVASLRLQVGDLIMWFFLMTGIRCPFFTLAAPPPPHGLPPPIFPYSNLP